MAGTNEEFKFPDEQENEKPIDVTVDEGEVEIEVVDDTPDKDKGRQPLKHDVADPTDDEIENYTKGAQDRIKELTHARHDERRAKEAAMRQQQELERFAQQLLAENNRLKSTITDGTEKFVSMAKDAAEAKLEKARREFKAAQEAFDSEALLKAQEALLEAKMELDNVKRARKEEKKAKKDAKNSLQDGDFEVQTTHTQPQRVQPDEKTLRWQAKNQWFGANGFEEVTSYALGLHQKLVTSGVDPRSDDYFEQIDARMKSKFPEVFGATEDKPRTNDAPRKPATVAAPATRSSGPKKIQLTQTQLALAKKFGLTPQQYAAQVAKLEN
jgi:hypothetical protein